jgi:hypothetical protein
MESSIHNNALEPRHHDDLGAPILDYMAPRFRDAGPTSLRTLRLEPGAAVQTWFDVAYAHSVIAGAVDLPPVSVHLLCQSSAAV